MKKFLSAIKELVLFVVEVAAIFLILEFSIFPASVIGSSMKPTLEDGSFGIGFKITAKIKINRFDTVVVDKKDSDKLIVKRVIGLPNDTIEYIDNVLYINDEKYDEPYLNNVTTEDFKITLQDDEYFIMGDNREVSLDSRKSGPYKREDIISTHFLVLYPFKEFGFVK